METRAVLIISCILFTCGFAGLLTVRLTNPFFKGLGWLGGAFCCGSVSALGFALRPNFPPDILIILPNFLVLAAYVFLDTCVLELIRSESLLPKFGISLLVVQIACFFTLRGVYDRELLCVVSLGYLLAAQLLKSAHRLKGALKPGMRGAAWFSFALLSGFSAFNIGRSTLVLLLRVPQNPYSPNTLELISAFVFLGVGLGLGFGMFWMASSHLRMTLEELANSDSLTGLYNRRMFLAMCIRENERSRRTGIPFSLFLLDVDHFKQINDAHGHRGGDAVLCRVAHTVRDSVRSFDVVGRWGGEEFVVLLPGTDMKTALVVAERVRQNIPQAGSENAVTGSKWSGSKLNITASIGIATGLGSANDIESLMHRCDMAMYEAKARGRNRVVVYEHLADPIDLLPSPKSCV